MAVSGCPCDPECCHSNFESIQALICICTCNSIHDDDVSYLTHRCAIVNLVLRPNGHVFMMLKTMALKADNIYCKNVKIGKNIKAG